MAKIINCPKCHKPTSINLSNAVDIDGEVFECEHCKYLFRFVNK